MVIQHSRNLRRHLNKQISCRVNEDVFQMHTQLHEVMTTTVVVKLYDNIYTLLLWPLVLEGMLQQYVKGEITW